MLSSPLFLSFQSAQFNPTQKDRLVAVYTSYIRVYNHISTNCRLTLEEERRIASCLMRVPALNSILNTGDQRILLRRRYVSYPLYYVFLPFNCLFIILTPLYDALVTHARFQSPILILNGLLYTFCSCLRSSTSLSPCLMNHQTTLLTYVLLHRQPGTVPGPIYTLFFTTSGSPSPLPLFLFLPPPFPSYSSSPTTL